MHLRRALLLFAIVLGLAAIATSLSRPGDRDGEDDGAPATATAPSATPAPGTSGPRAELTFAAGDGGAQRIRTGQAATVLVEVDEPGQAAIEDLGVSAAAEPLTPARFELLASRPGRYPIVFTPASGGEPLEAGTLVVREDGE